MGVVYNTCYLNSTGFRVIVVHSLYHCYLYFEIYRLGFVISVAIISSSISRSSSSSSSSSSSN